MSHSTKAAAATIRRLSSSFTTVERLLADRTAVAATEFALILPFMLILLLGTVEVSDALNQDRKVSRMANAIADLVAQAQTVKKSELNLVLDLGSTILEPYSDDGLEIIVASVAFNSSGTPSVVWSYNTAGASPWTKGAAPPITLPATVASPSSSIVIGQANLKFTPRFVGLFTDFFKRLSSMTLSDTYYLRPRLTGTVTCSDC